MTLGESIFLFVWAALSNTRDFIIDYAINIIENFSSSPKRRERQQQRRKIQAYFERFKRQIGIDSGDNNPSKLKKKSFAQKNTPRTQTSNTESSKIESLENELMMLKQELATLSKQKKQIRKKKVVRKQKKVSEVSTDEESVTRHEAKQGTVDEPQDVYPPPPPPPPMNLSISSETTNPPPPPPPPPPMNLAMNSKSKTTIQPPPMNLPKKREPLKERNTVNTPPSLSIASELSKVKLRKVNVEEKKKNPKSELLAMIKSGKGRLLLKATQQNRSPGGTPRKKEKNRSSFQNELFFALAKKFAKTNLHSPEVSGEDSDSDFSPSPKKIKKEGGVKTPIRNLTELMDEIENKENLNSQSANQTPVTPQIPLTNVL